MDYKYTYCMGMTSDIRAGTIVHAERFAEARVPAYKLRIDLGSEVGEKWSSAQITAHYTPEELIGTRVLAVVDLPPKQIGPFWSEVLVLGLPDAENEIVLARPEWEVPNGARLC